MNIFEVLKRDHKTVLGLFEKIERTTNKQVQVREKLFSTIKTELSIQVDLEEKIFYSELRKFPQTVELISEAYNEHNLVRDVLEELAVMSKDENEWIINVLELKRIVEHHVHEEENEIFIKAKQVLSQEQIQEMGLQMKIEKDKLLPLNYQIK